MEKSRETTNVGPRASNWILLGIVLMLIGGGTWFTWYYLTPGCVGGGDERELTEMRIKLVEKACENYHFDHGFYPATLQDLVKKSNDDFGPYLRDYDAIRDFEGHLIGYDPEAIDAKGVKRPMIVIVLKGQIFSNFK